MESVWNWNFSAHDVGYGLGNLLMGHITRIVVLIDSKYTGVLTELPMQILKITWVLGDHDQPVGTRIDKVLHIRGATQASIFRNSYRMLMWRLARERYEHLAVSAIVKI